MERYYTYLWLREDGTPYYAGKGKGQRAFRKGCPPHERIIVQDHPSEQAALDAEMFLIAYYGRKDTGTGILRNHTDGGEGLSGCVFTHQHRSRIATSLKGHPVSEPIRTALANARHKDGRGAALGKWCVESGHLASIARAGGLAITTEQHSRMGKKGIATARALHPDLCINANKKANHNRWHVNRGVLKEGCALCSSR